MFDPSVSCANNQSERDLQEETRTRKAGYTSKTTKEATRRSTIVSVFAIQQQQTKNEQIRYTRNNSVVGMTGFWQYCATTGQPIDQVDAVYGIVFLMPYQIVQYFLVVCLVVSCFIAGCRPVKNIAETPADPFVKPDIAFILLKLEEAFGAVERDSQGTIIGVNLAQERASATDETLKLTLSLPNLKKLRLAGGTISAAAFVDLKTQTDLEELFLLDMTILDEDLLSVISLLPKLRRLTLRRLPNISDTGMSPLFRSQTLRQLALIDMPLSGVALQTIDKSATLVALDIRNCAQVVPDDFKHLVRLPQLVDLKIGGFAVNDRCLEIIALLPALKGLTLDDSMVSAQGFENLMATSLFAGSLETLVLNRNMTLSDDALLAVGNLPRLKRLILGDAMVTGKFLERLAEKEEQRPQFNDIALRKTLLTEEAIASFKQYSELKSLQITGIALSKKGIAILLSLSQLDRLDLSDCFFDEDARKYLQETELPAFFFME